MSNRIYRGIPMAGILLLFQLFLSFAAKGQTLNLYDAVDNSVKNYPLLRQRQAEVSAARAHIKTVNGNHLPSLILQDQLNMGTANSLQGSYFPLGIVPSGSGSTTAERYNPNPGNVAISFLQWEFFNFGYSQAQRKEAGAQLAVSEATLGVDQYLLTENVVSVYLDWLKKYRMLRIQNENMLRARVILNAIRATVLSGLKPGVDSSTASGVYSEAHIAYLQALDEYNYGRLALSSYTGVTASDIIPDTTTLSATLLQSQAQIPQKDNVTSDHPLLNVYQKQYEQQQVSNNVLSKKYLPRLGVDGATWVRNSGISPAGVYPESLSGGLPYSKTNYLLGITMSYNLFDLRHRHDQLEEGKYIVEARQDALQTQQLTLNRMMQQANATYAITVEKIKEVPIQLFSARQAYEQQSALYRAGLNTLIEVTNAQYVLLQAETNYVIIQDELLRLLFIKAGLTGQLDIFLQNFKH